MGIKASAGVYKPPPPLHFHSTIDINHWIVKKRKKERKKENILFFALLKKRKKASRCTPLYLFGVPEEIKGWGVVYSAII